MRQTHTRAHTHTPTHTRAPLRGEGIPFLRSVAVNNSPEDNWWGAVNQLTSVITVWPSITDGDRALVEDGEDGLRERTTAEDEAHRGDPTAKQHSWTC